MRSSCCHRWPAGWPPHTQPAGDAGRGQGLQGRQVRQVRERERNSTSELVVSLGRWTVMGAAGMLITGAADGSAEQQLSGWMGPISRAATFRLDGRHQPLHNHHQPCTTAGTPHHSSSNAARDSSHQTTHAQRSAAARPLTPALPHHAVPASINRGVPLGPGTHCPTQLLPPAGW